MNEQELPPSMGEWKDLYEAAQDFKELGCWDWMYDADLFGVEDPVSGEIGYCCIMGAGGEHFALGVYQGSEGLAGYLQMQSGEIPEEPVEALTLQKCLMASFEDRERLEKPDLETIKQLSLKFRGRHAWPLFRGYRPCYCPWFVTGKEARFLIIALRQSVQVAPRFREDPHLLDPPQRGQFLIRVPRKVEGSVEWSDAWRAPAPYVPTSVDPEPIDFDRLQRIVETAGSTDGILEMDFSLSPGGVRESKGERPYYPYLVLVVDHSSGFVFDAEFVSANELNSAFAEKLLKLIEQHQMIPREIQIRREEAAALLNTVAMSLDIRLSRKPRLKSLDKAKREFFNYMKLTG
ncbi:MAG: hypothetical protein HY318_12260 [Armatimonadetes bacterium]|nr:hypothetical protein [Armatimonadota bacterium]